MSFNSEYKATQDSPTSSTCEVCDFVINRTHVPSVQIVTIVWPASQFCYLVRVHTILNHCKMIYVTVILCNLFRNLVFYARETLSYKDPRRHCANAVR